MHVDIIPITKLDKRSNGILKIQLNSLPLPSEYVNYHPVLIYIPPLQYGGNHKHSHREMFISLSQDVEVHWIDENGMKQVNTMRENDEIYLFVIHPLVPHAIVNVSKESPAVILEWTDSSRHNAESIMVHELYSIENVHK